MFINTAGGLQHKQHKPHSGQHHLQPQRHHHGHRHPQQFDQHHHRFWSGRLAAPRHLLLPGPRHRGSLSSPAALLLKTLHLHFLVTSPPKSSLTPPSLHCTETTRLTMDGLHNLLCPP